MRIPPEWLEARRRQREAERVLEEVAPWRLRFAHERLASLRKQRRNAAKGGQARRGAHKVPPEQLCSEVAAMRERPGRLSWSAACARVAKRHGLSERHVRRLTPSVKW